MLPATRKNRIKEIITEKKSVTVSELATLFNVTEETIRRDLNSFKNEGFITRTYGGAFVQEGTLNEINYSIREADHIDSKRIIALKCKNYVRNGDSVYLDSSTTASYIAEELSNMRITVLTDSLKIINLLSNNENIHLIATGGELYQRSMSFIGPGAINSINQYFVDIAFISCRSISIDHHITDSNEHLSQIRQNVIGRANKTFLVADFSKFGKTSFFNICKFDDIHSIITDRPLDENWHSTVERYGVELNDEELK